MNFRRFTHVARIIREARERTPWSQSELSTMLGYKNGQFISNIERGKCSVPIRKVGEICAKMNIPPEKIKEAMLKDLGESFDVFFDKGLKLHGEQL
jgi:ribosome-binding protein aMBF1 (putative translation factor)